MIEFVNWSDIILLFFPSETLDSMMCVWLYHSAIDMEPATVLVLFHLISPAEDSFMFPDQPFPSGVCVCVVLGRVYPIYPGPVN